MLDKILFQKEIYSNTNRRDFLKTLGKSAIVISGGISAINFLAGCGCGGGGGGGSTTTDNTTDNTNTTDNGNNTGTNGTGGTTTNGDTGKGCDNNYILTNLKNWKTDYSPEEIRNTIISSSWGLSDNFIWTWGSLILQQPPNPLLLRGNFYFSVERAVGQVRFYLFLANANFGDINT